MNAYEIMSQIVANKKGMQNKPRKKSSEQEHHIQIACVNWFRMEYRDLAKSLFAVPNGGYRNEVTAGKMKAEGQLAGVSDLILLHRNEQYGALLIEMKTPSGKQSDRQKDWQRHIEPKGYRYVVCHSLEEFKNEIENYLSIA